MFSGNRLEFRCDSRTWVLVPRIGLSTAQLQGAVPADAAARELDRWCSDPIAWGHMLDLFREISRPFVGAPTTLAVEREIKPILRGALSTGSWVAFQASANVQTAALQLVRAAANEVFVMDDTPRMPSIDVIVNVTGVTPDPTSTTAFDWTAELRHNPRADGDRNGPNRNFAADSRGNGVGGRFAVAFTELMAGQLTITVRATVGGTTISARTVGVTIVAMNPTKANVQAEIGDDLLRRIACHESGQRQFATAPGNTTRSPLWSGDGLGGVGLFQITVPRPTDAQTWNWRENVAAGRARLEQGRRAARNYPYQIRGSRTLAGMLTGLNQRRHAAGRPAIPAITVPELSQAQIEDDAIRAFNGYGGNRDQFGFALHEFRLQMVGADLRLAIDEAALTAIATWERVPVADRGRAGDPNYVNNVNGSNPTCP
jgi:hypothetical protein